MSDLPFGVGGTNTRGDHMHEATSLQHAMQIFSGFLLQAKADAVTITQVRVVVSPGAILKRKGCPLNRIFPYSPQLGSLVQDIFLISISAPILSPTSTSNMAHVSPEVAIAITRQKARYCRYADTKQWDKLASDVTLPNARLAYCDSAGAPLRVSGRALVFDSAASFAAFYAKFFAPVDSMHNQIGRASCRERVL